MADRYKNIKEFKTDEGIRYYANSIVPDIPLNENDIYLIATIADRYDVLAQEFYGNSALWWIIAAANTSRKDSLIPTPGLQIRVPYNPSSIVAEYNKLNQNR